MDSLPLTIGTNRFPVDDAAVDLVLCIEVPGVLESAWFRQEAARVLKPGGVLIGVFHHRNSARGLFRAIVDGSRKQYCYYQMGYRNWTVQMRALGMELIHAQGLCWFPYGRLSNSLLVPPSIFVDQSIGLHALPTLSPWVVFIAQKTPAGNGGLISNAWKPS